jgi:hypothetical protein
VNPIQLRKMLERFPPDATVAQFAAALSIGAASTECRHCGLTISTAMVTDGVWYHDDGGYRQCSSAAISADEAAGRKPDLSGTRFQGKSAQPVKGWNE